MKYCTLPGFLLLLTLVCAAPSAPRSPRGIDAVVALLNRLDDPAAQADVLRGMAEALKGRRDLPMPGGWRAAYAKLQNSPDARVREQSTELALRFGDAQALASLRARVTDAKAPAAERQKAIEDLVQNQDATLGPILLSVLDDPSIRDAAIRGLAAYAQDATPHALLARYASFSASQRRDAVNTLASRPAWAAALLDAVEAGTVPHADVSAFTVRQLAGLKDRAVDERLKKFFGAVRPPAQDKAALIALYKKTFTPDMMAKADPAHGRAIFDKTCATCHTLFGSGGKVGPDLTGSQRANLDYILENVVDPSAVVAKDYYMTVIETRDGRTITGIIKHEDNASLTIRNAAEDVTLAKADVKKRTTSPISMMPEGLLEALGTENARDLISYLASPTQVVAREKPEGGKEKTEAASQ